MGELYFQFVCLFTPRGVPHLHPIIPPLVPCPFWGVPSDWSQVPSGGYASPMWGRGTPVQDGGYPGQVRMRYPLARSGWGTPPPKKQVTLGHVMPFAARLLRFPAGELPCLQEKLGQGYTQMLNLKPKQQVIRTKARLCLQF